MSTPYTQSLEIVKAAIDGFTERTAIAPEASEIRKFDEADVLEHGGLTVRYEERWGEGEGSLGRDDFYFPIHVCFCREAEERLRDEDEVAVFAFFEKVRDYFHYQRRFASVSQTGWCELHAIVREGPKLSQSGKDVRTMTIRAWFRRTR